MSVIAYVYRLAPFQVRASKARNSQKNQHSIFSNKHLRAFWNKIELNLIKPATYQQKTPQKFTEAKSI